MLREDVDREAAIGVGIRTGVTAVLGAFVTLLVGDFLGPIDDAAALAVLSSPLYATAGWLSAKRWWRRRQRALGEAHTASVEALQVKAAGLALPPSDDR